MGMPVLDVKVTMKEVRCILHGEDDSDEPYLWAAVFKIDGDTAYFDGTSLQLAGGATVMTTNGQPRNLGVAHMRAGDSAAVPPSVGQFVTQLKPIPVRPPLGPLTEIEPSLGCVMILMEEDNTPNTVVGDAYRALGDAMKRELDSLIPRLGLRQREPTPEDMDEFSRNVEEAIKAAVLDQSIFDLIQTAVDPDDKIGSYVLRFSYGQLFRNPIIGWSKVWTEEGEWQLSGGIEAHAMYEFVPNPREDNTRLVPIHDAKTSEWAGTWHGTPSGHDMPRIVVTIDAEPSGTFKVGVVESVAFPPLALQFGGLSVESLLDTPYAGDDWTLRFDRAPLGPRQQGGIRDRARIRMPRPGTEPSTIARSRLRYVDALRVNSEITLELYGEQAPDGTITRYRVRYVRVASNGEAVQDVMLKRHYRIG